ncbi:MAG: diacylglycerol kinase family lipid kinase [Proteobacteria bacterium]|nr:diacylglycerol kinase family lipid kinase [Cystobacterineae bacterium]MCL2258440.1 diacylglycerol kinase family lipid kinase [Cystobacterineae bacterium]MCL2315233.1 diacylglycerol kinase family lipid kinase [Pseudomonadota bacterium]
MRIFFVVNAHSANGETGRCWPEIHAQGMRSLGEMNCAFTERPMDAVRLTRWALRGGYDCIVAVGGDGTLSEVVNGFFDEGGPLAPEARLAILPRGTGCDFRRTFGWTLKLDEAFERIRLRKTILVDVGFLECMGGDGKPHSRYFMNECSFGVSGEIAKRANDTTKVFGGKASFMLAALRAMARYSDKEVEVCMDGETPKCWPITSLTVANGAYFGGGMKVAPEANIMDGLLNITVWSNYGLSDFIWKNRSIYSGAHTRLSRTRQYTCKTLTARSRQEVLIDCDGEQPGKLPCSIRVVPQAIRLCV